MWAGRVCYMLELEQEQERLFLIFTQFGGELNHPLRYHHLGLGYMWILGIETSEREVGTLFTQLDGKFG